MSKRLRARRRIASLPAAAYATTDKGRIIRRSAQTTAPALSTLVGAALSRRGLLLGSAAMAATALLPGGRAEAATTTAAFPELKRVMDEHDHIADGYDRQILIRWGDKVLPDAPAFDPATLTAAAASRQFGTNNDLLVFQPLPFGSGSSDHGLLFVNHEYPNPHLTWPGLTEDDAGAKMTEAQVAATMAMVGCSVIEVKNDGTGWQVVPDSRYARRITAETPIRISGPAAGHPLMRTKADPEGRTVLGTFDNCNGGMTPWGTVLSCEEGFDGWFGGDPTKSEHAALLARYGAGEEEDGHGWGRFHDRFHYDREPNEAHRFDWVVEIDPHDPASQPVKRTALGRFTHENASCVVAPDGRVVVYMADDHDFDYLYKFVTARPWNAQDRAANRNLLDEGTLHVARFNDDGTLDWLPLVQGEGRLTAENGFATPGDVAIKTRLAADLMGATPMDSPEGFSVNPVTGRVYVALTENEDIEPGQVNAANPRAPNPEGHLLELTPPAAGGQVDHAATRYGWDIFILCGDPAKPEARARYHPATSADGWFTDPDNISFDPAGRMYVCTDGPPDAGFNDALYVLDTDGPGRALPKLFYSPPQGSECSAPCFTPDGRTLFLSVQHPGEDSDSLETVSTRWPDFQGGMPPRPSVVVIRRHDGGPIGT